MTSTKEENEVDLIKDFLKQRGYKSTLECFEKEDSFKNSDKKGSKENIPEDKQSKLTKLQDAYQLLDKKHKRQDKFFPL